MNATVNTSLGRAKVDLEDGKELEVTSLSRCDPSDTAAETGEVRCLRRKVLRDSSLLGFTCAPGVGDVSHEQWAPSSETRGNTCFPLGLCPRC